jgi:hypothetical protein
MFKKCYLHIGPPKTGTTSIQNAMWNNRDLLEGCSIHYPSIEINHRFMVSCFIEDATNFDYNKYYNRTVEQVSINNYNMLSRFKSEAVASGCDTLVISAEHLVMLRDDGIKNLRDYLRELCEVIYVVIYVRHPMNAVGSYVQEAVKNGARRLAEMRRNPPFARYGQIVPLWERYFGGGAIVLRVMNKDALINGDVVDDFLYTIGYTGTFECVSCMIENPSLTAPAVLIADALASIAPKYSPLRGGVDYLTQIRGPAYIPDRYIMESVASLSRPDLVYLEDRWGIILPEVTYDDSLRPEFDEDAILSIAEILNKLSR